MTTLFKKKAFWVNFLKWNSLLVILVSVIVITLTIRADGFSIGSWRVSSGTSIIDGSQTALGAGQAQITTKQIIITFFGGGSLAFAGTLLQKVTKNRLAEVSILGIGSINILFIYIYISNVGVDAFSNGIAGILMPILLFGFSILGTLFIWALSESRFSNKNTFVIVGIAVQLLFEAISVVVVNPSKLVNAGEDSRAAWSRIKAYTLGQVRIDPTHDNYLPWWLLGTVAVIIVIIIGFAMVIRKKIDVLEASNKIATGVGINIKKLKLAIYLLVAILAGASTIIIGQIALLGIIAPSFARLIFRNRFSSLGLASFIIGGALVMFASWISINMLSNIPVGILSTAIVVPFFIYKLIRTNTW